MAARRRRKPPSASRTPLLGLMTPQHPACRPFSEPAETEHMARVNAALELVETYARTVIDAGGESALRQRLARLLPLDPFAASKGTASRGTA